MVSNILIFDSGVGGLSVYQQIHQLLPQHNYIYFFDNQAYPYGELAPSVLLERVRYFVSRMVEMHNIDIVVIACNTASTIVLPTLRDILTIPVVGVVPAIKPACNLAHQSVGLIATPATIKRPYTHELIHDFSCNKKVILLGSTKLVDIAEEKMRGEAIDLAVVKQILQPLADKIDVAVLGCTHFPLIRDEIQDVLGRRVLLVDSGQAIARRVQSLISQQKTQQDKQPSLIFSSAPPFKEKALNHTLKALGFNPVAWFRDFSDHLQCGL